MKWSLNKGRLLSCSPLFDLRGGSPAPGKHVCRPLKLLSVLDFSTYDQVQTRRALGASLLKIVTDNLFGVSPELVSLRCNACLRIFFGEAWFVLEHSYIGTGIGILYVAPTNISGLLLPPATKQQNKTYITKYIPIPRILKS